MGGERTLAAVGPEEEVEFAVIALTPSEGTVVELAERVGVVDGSPVVVAVWEIVGDVPMVPVPNIEMPVG